MKSIKFTLIVLTLFGSLVCNSQPIEVKNTSQNEKPKVVLITIDGLRWQELFGGADGALIANKEFIENKSELDSLFAGADKMERREKLMPFFWSKIVQDGTILGNRYKNSQVKLTNTMHFSYPGYNEILTGYADDKNINSNDKIYNKNITILEKLNNDDRFRGSVYAFASWDVFPYIINDKRSQIPVNAGYSHSLAKNPSEKELFLNEIQDKTPRRWAGVRFDVFTHNYALETLEKEHPQMVYISYGETDDFAHDGRYDHYLKSAHNTDKMIQEIWAFLQSDPFYRDHTTLIITTDHGRGNKPDSGNQSWRHHGTKYKDSEYTWIAMLGKGIDAKGEVNNGKTYYTNQIANTIAHLLNFETEDERMGKSILEE